MVQLSNRNGSKYVPPEFQTGTSFVFYQSDAEQSSHAKLMDAEAEHRKEETKKLKRENFWRQIIQRLFGFVTYGGILAIGLFLGVVFF